MNLFEILPWEDVIVHHILPHLSWETLLNLEHVCRAAKECVGIFFAVGQTFDFSFVPKSFTSNTFRHITLNCHNLLSLNLANSTAWLVTDSLISVIGCNFNLRKIVLTGCNQLNRNVLNVIAGNCPLLSELWLGQCHWVARDPFRVVSANCKELKVVEIAACWDLDDQSILALVSNCPKLEYIDASKIYGLTDKSIEYILQFAKSLRHLKICHCWRITDWSMRLVAEYCPSLESLDLESCRVSNAVLDKLRRAKIKLDVPEGPKFTIRSLHPNHQI